MITEELVNKSLVRAWGWWALLWLTVFPLVGLLVSIKFNSPDFLGGIPWLTFGRLRPVHVNGVIFGAFSTTFLGIVYYIVPRLCGIRMYREEWGWWILWLWNAFLILGTLSLLLGYNLGLEAAEFEWPFNILRFTVLFFVAIQVLVTIFRRTEPRFYVALWYIVAAIVWTMLNLVLGNAILPYSGVSGVNSAAMHGLYIHYVVGLWLTPAGLSMIYYFLPVSTDNPLYSHKLSILGFWSLALLYPFVGTHHYLFSPIPYWTQTISIVTSMLLIIPVWTVTVNFFGTMKGRWGTVLGGGGANNYAAKFLMLGALYYLIGCFQGSTEALRRIQELTHFNDFVIAHSHITVFGAMVVWAIGGLYYVWPQVTGRRLWSDKLASWHLWLTVSGFTIMSIGLIIQGFIQGSMLEYGANFMDTLNVMKPWWLVRTLAGLTMDTGILLMFINFYKTSKEGTLIGKEDLGTRREKVTTVQAVFKPNWLESPSKVFVLAGIVFFLLALIIQGIVPLSMSATRVSTVTDVVTGKRINVPDYTPLEQKGRRVYIREGCWYCHSQYIRPVTGESSRWGPISQTGEYAYDRPHLFGTRRIGPDLARIGLKYGDDWHMEHLWDPRAVRLDSIMPSFPWLFKAGEDGVPVLNDDGKALVAYIQRLGTTIGDWREGFVSTSLAGGIRPELTLQSRAELVTLGKEVYEHLCQNCHGIKGDGKGFSPQMLHPGPRNFSSGIFKFHSTEGKDALPTDEDLFITITHGLSGSAMPPWYALSDRERIAVIQYIKTFSDRWQKEPVGEPIIIIVPDEPALTKASIEQGKLLFQTNCFVCHGMQGHGDGPVSGALKDTWGNPVRPADFSLPAGKPGGVKLGHNGEHLFKTIMGGVGGTPMPPFKGQLTPGQVWDIVHYVQSLRVEAHMSELLETGLSQADLGEARQRIWASISRAADQGHIEEEVLKITTSP